LELIATRVSYVVQEAIVVMKDIFRRYPSSYEGVIPTLCAALDELDEPEAKASLIWIIGEYAEKIENAGELLGIFVDTFTEEAYQVQLQTLTAVVKLFLKKPDNAQGVVQRVLETATKDCDSPDVRDRAYIYWRLLSTDPGAAKAVVLADRPPITLPQTTLSPALLEELIGEISSLASAYHKPEETFVGRGRLGADTLQKKATDMGNDLLREKALQAVVAGQQAENLLDFDDEPATEGAPVGLAATTASIAATPAGASLMTSSNPLDDLVSIFGSSSGLGGGAVPAPAPGQPQLDLQSLSPSPTPPSIMTPVQQVQAAPKPQSAEEDLLGLF
jgi:hypothetical protein